MRKIAFLLLLAAWSAAPAAADLEAARVLAIAGTAEIQRANGRWTALAPGVTASSGDRIRTGDKSSVDFGFDRALDGMTRLGEKTSARIEAPARWQLTQGKMWVLWEYENDAKGPFEVRMDDFLEARIEGGAFVEALPARIEIRSFGSVSALNSGRPQGELAEGFRGIVEGGRAAPEERLGFADYQDWRAWMVEAYHYKDDKAKNL